jgi:hypothetical protein
MELLGWIIFGLMMLGFIVWGYFQDRKRDQRTKDDTR